MKDLEKKVINDFGKEWMLFNHMYPNEIIQKNNFNQYFYNFPFKLLNKNSFFYIYKQNRTGYLF